MRLRNIPGARDSIRESDYCIDEPSSLKGKWNTLFGNDNPIYIEVGMGKGQFIHTHAKLHPNINYIGIEKFSSVLLRALQKMDADPLSNLKFIRMDAEYITDVFDKDEISKIYLNFSDPWPKDRHAKRRLTSSRFLERYSNFLKPDGELEFKTDNKALFDFSIEEINSSGWVLLFVTNDLHSNPNLCIDNIMTEYEERFSKMGNPIHKLITCRLDK